MQLGSDWSLGIQGVWVKCLALRVWFQGVASFIGLAF